MFVKIIGEESPIETIELEKPTNTSTIKQTIDRVLVDSSVKYRKILFYNLFEVHRTCYCLFSHSLKFG